VRDFGIDFFGLFLVNQFLPIGKKTGMLEASISLTMLIDIGTTSKALTANA
jgi:hypothetical protein